MTGAVFSRRLEQEKAMTGVLVSRSLEQDKSITGCLYHGRWNRRRA